jgi:coatomer subunit beta'
VVACGDGEYIIYTSMALSKTAYGFAQEFIWSRDSSEYAIRDGNQIKIFKDFTERKAFKPSFGMESIFGGQLMGVKSVNGLSFYDWETTDLIRRIEITPKLVFWSENGEQVCIACENSFNVFRYSGGKIPLINVN